MRPDDTPAPLDKHATCGMCLLHSAAGQTTDNATRERLLQSCRVRRFRSGATIALDGEAVRFVGFVREGVLRVQKINQDGRVQIVGLLMAPDHFGRVFAETSNYGIEAATDTVLCSSERQIFEGLLERYPVLEHEFLLTVLDELDAAREGMLLLGYQPVRSRIAAFLLILLRRLGEVAVVGRNSPMEIRVPISRTDMANYLGTRVETISRMVQGLAREGVITILTPQHLRVNALNRLVEIAGSDEFLHAHTLHRLRGTELP